MSGTILVVDDSPICREPLVAMLRVKGYNAVPAADGEQALALVPKEKPGLILLDIAMPRMNGIAMLEALRANPEHRDIPVILLTAVGGKDFVLRARELGVQGYMLKSNFSMTELLERIG